MNLVELLPNSIKRQRWQKIIKLRGLIGELTVAVGSYSRKGGLLKSFSSRVGAYSRGGAFLRGANSKIYGMLC